MRWHSQVKLFRWTSLVDQSTAALPNKTSSNKLSLIYSFHHCHCTACVHSIPHCQMRKGKPIKSLERSWHHNPTSPDLPPLVMSRVDFQVATNVRARHVSLEKVSGGNLFLLRPSHSANHLASSQIIKKWLVPEEFLFLEREAPHFSLLSPNLKCRASQRILNPDTSKSRLAGYLLPGQASAPPPVWSPGDKRRRWIGSRPARATVATPWIVYLLEFAWDLCVWFQQATPASC